MIFKTFLVLVLLLVSGCAGQRLPSIPFDRAGGNVQSIALVTPATPDKPILISLAPVTPLPIFIGIIGTLADQSVQKDHAAHFAEILANHDFRPQPLLVADITQVLQAKGYAVTIVEADRSGQDFLAQYPPGMPPAGDAYLDVMLANHGYGATTTFDPYQPLIGLKFRLVRTSDNKVLMQDTFAYSNIGHAVRPEPKYDYQHYVDFSSDQDRSIEGIKEGLQRGADAIGSALN